VKFNIECLSYSRDAAVRAHCNFSKAAFHHHFHLIKSAVTDRRPRP
jgi:hypothetical protein